MASQNQWVYDLENLTYAIVKTRCEKKLKTKYPKLKFTQEEQSDSATASFPTVLVQALEPIEQNEDLECERINTVLFTAQSTIIGSVLTFGIKLQAVIFYSRMTET